MASGTPTPLIELSSDSADIRWGVAEFIAAEEMGRMRGIGGRQMAHNFSSPVDNSPVSEWSPATRRSPGTTPVDEIPGGWNCKCHGHLPSCRSLIRSANLVEDAAGFRIRARASWDSFGPLLAAIADQRTLNASG